MIYSTDPNELGSSDTSVRSSRGSKQARTITNTRTENKVENMRFNEARQISYVLGAEGREILLIKSLIQITNKGTTPIYI